MGDLDRAKELFTGLAGAPPTSDTPYYVGWTLPDQEIGLVPNGQANGLPGPVAYWHVPDIAAATQIVATSGGKTQQEAKDVGGGRLIALVEDADGNVIGLLQDP